MPKYLSEKTIKDAVDRLSVCSANSSLSDFLIFKRAAVLTAMADGSSVSSAQVVTGTKSKPFVAAIEAFTKVGGAESPYYLPFGSKRDKTAGYRTDKYPSNGSSDTARNWQGRDGKPLVLVANSSPKKYVFEKRTAKQLADFFLVRNGAEGRFSGEKPRLLDVAIWWFREKEFSEELTAKQLVQALIADFTLNAEEIEGLFHSGDDTGAQTHVDKE